MTQQAVEEAHESGPAPPVPVHIPHSVDTQQQAADYGAWAAYHLAGTEAAQPILPYDTYRHRATIAVASAAAAASYNPAPGVQSSPGAGTVLVSQVLPAGTYTANWAVILGGTIGAQDRDNVGLYVGGTLVATSQNGINSGTVYSQPAESIVVPAGGATVTLQVIGAGTASSVYQGDLVLAQAASAVVYLGTQAQCQQKLGGVLVPGQVVVVQNNQQLWMAPDGTNPVTVTVLAERWDNGT